MGIGGATQGRWRELKLALLRRRLNVGLLWICAALLAASPHSAQANHVHMHGGPFIGVILAVAVNPLSPETLYVAAHGGGVFRSDDRGTSWVAVNEGLPNRQVFSLLLDPRQKSSVYLGTDQGIFHRSNGGAWRMVSVALAKRNIRALAVDPQKPNLIYAATDQGVF